MGNTTYLSIASNDNPRTGRADILEYSAPGYTASLLAIKQFDELFSTSLGLYFVDNIAWPGSVTNISNNYTAADLKLSRKIYLSGGTAKISFVLKNMHEAYSSFDPGPDNGPLVENNFTGIMEFELKLK